MTRATILHEAAEELWQAVAWYEERCSGLGLDFQQEVKVAVESIQRFPNRWPIRKDGTRRLLIERFPYVVVYVAESDHVWILAVAHCKRHPGYWRSRVHQG